MLFFELIVLLGTLKFKIEFTIIALRLVSYSCDNETKTESIDVCNII